MYVKLKTAEGSDTYCCRYVDIHEIGEGSPAARNGTATAGTSVQVCHATSLTTERRTSDGKTRIDSTPLDDITKTLSLPEDGEALFVMDNQRNTTNILRIRKEETSA